MDYENQAVPLIVHAGNAKSLAMLSIEAAKKGEFEEARAYLRQSDEAMLQAHQIHTDILRQTAAAGEESIGMLLAHAQDHLMAAITTLELAREFCDLYKIVYELKEEKGGSQA